MTTPAAPRSSDTSTRPARSPLRNDPLHPRVARAVAELLQNSIFVAPVDVLLKLGMLERTQLEDWRHGRVAYLERVIRGNLKKCSRLLRVLHAHSLSIGLTPSSTAYMRWGDGPRQRLRFTRYADANLEAAYALHFVRKGRRPGHAAASTRDGRGAERPASPPPDRDDGLPP